MSLLSKLLGGQTATPTGRTPRERARRARDISKIDAAGRKLLARDGLAPTKGRR